MTRPIDKVKPNHLGAAYDKQDLKDDTNADDKAWSKTENCTPHIFFIQYDLKNIITWTKPLLPVAL